MGWIYLIGLPIVLTILSVWYLFGGEAIRLLDAAKTPMDMGTIIIYNIASSVWLGALAYALFRFTCEQVAHLGKQWRDEQASEVENVE